MSAVIPLVATPSQVVNVALGGQSCTIKVYQLATGLFVDVYVNGAAVIVGVIARNMTRIVRNAYLGFVGDLTFYDTQGVADPDYTGLGGRFEFVYLEAGEVTG